jgi:mono/diheme cytochrome c family protein
MSLRVGMFVVAVFLVGCLAASAQTAPPTSGSQAAKPEIKHVPASYTSPSSGKEMYDSYCASCHGVDGKGDGPAAPALKAVPTNLTTLAVKNSGTFPAAHVATKIQGGAMIPAHGSKEMPVWGPIFMTMGGHSTAQVELRIRNLTNYLESIQVK